MPYPNPDNEPIATNKIAIVFATLFEERSGKTIAVPIWSPNSFPITKADKKIP